LCRGCAQQEGDTDGNQGIRSQIPASEEVFFLKKGEGTKHLWRLRSESAVTGRCSLWNSGARRYAPSYPN